MKTWGHEIKNQIRSSPLVLGTAAAVSRGLSRKQDDLTGFCQQSWRWAVHLEQMVASGTQRRSREGEVPGSRAAQPGINVAGRSRQPTRLDRAASKSFGCGDVARTFAGATVLSLSSATRVLVATTPVDLRSSFNRLYSLVVEQLKSDPLSGHLFVFTNGRRNRIKVLYWDGSGLWVCAKRLEKGRFTWPVSDEGQIALRGEEFSALIHGLEVRSKKNWYRR